MAARLLVQIFPAHLYNVSPPADTSTTNLSVQVNVNLQGFMSGKNVIYDFRDAQGAVYRIARVYDVYSKNMYPAAQRGPSYNYNPAPGSLEHTDLLKYVYYCETYLKDYRPPNVNVHRSGALLSRNPIPPAQPAPAPTPSSSELLTRIQELTHHIDTLNKKVEILERTNGHLVQEVEKLKHLILSLTSLLAVMSRNL